MINIIKADEKPISTMGMCAAVCYGKPVDMEDVEGNYKRGLDCIKDDHGRVEEYPDVIMEISGYSARVIRELYTHIKGTSRLQESTRYVNMDEFGYFVPPSIKNNEDAFAEYEYLMQMLARGYNRLINNFDIPKEDAANILPLGSHTRIVFKINVRALLHLAEERMCARAYYEFRLLMNEMIATLANYGIVNEDKEWEEIASMMKPKCEVVGYCKESRSCGRVIKKKDMIDILQERVYNAEEAEKIGWAKLPKAITENFELPCFIDKSLNISKI